MGSVTLNSAAAIDILIIGSGVAGLAAAIEAAKQGAHVTVVEAHNSLGGASALSGGGCCLVQTPLQEQNGIVDGVELALSDWLAMGGPTADQVWARKYLENSKVDVYDWAEKLGIKWIAPLRQPEGNTVPRWHQPEGWGRRVVQVLLQHARSLGVEFRVRSAAKQLICEKGTITGVEVHSEGCTERVSCSSVIVCTGGFSGNLSKVLENAAQLRTLPRVLSGGASLAKGFGHDMMKDAGADFRSLDHVWVYPVGTPDPTDQSGQRGLGVRGARGDIWLNREGRRFHNERLNGGKSGTNALLAQPGQTAWMVFHASEIKNLELINNAEYFPPAPSEKILPRMSSFWTDSAYAHLVRSINELAESTGLPFDAVAATINAYNAEIASGAEIDAQHSRPLQDALILEGNLAAIQLFPMAQKTFGGVRTDLSCRVVDQAGTPIQGLFSAGEVAGMAGGCINGKSAIEGTMFGPCLYSGRMAGIAARENLPQGNEC